MTIHSYDHHRRVIELNGLPCAGWSECVGGGVARNGQQHVFDERSDEPRDVTDGRAMPQDITIKLEVCAWQTLKACLVNTAAESGDASDTGYQKVSWTLVDQWRGADATQPTVTRTHMVKIKEERPEMPNDGGQFHYTLVLAQTNLPQETYGT